MIDWEELSKQVGDQISAAGKDAAEWSRWLAKQDLGSFGIGGSTPSARKYAECKDNGGEAGWDEHGMWRCLFPGSQRPNTFYSEYKRFLEDRHAAYKREQQALQQQQNRNYTLVDSSEAKGKTVTGRSVNIESSTGDDGKLVSRKRTVTYYGDGTASVEEKQGSGSWFWRDE